MGRPLKPAAQRRNAHAPRLGEWQPAPGLGWQHGPIPEPPDGLLAASREAWAIWMRSWFASHWSAADLPGLTVVITAFDAVKRQSPAKANDLTSLVRLMDTYGITPAGQQSRRWTAPEVPGTPEPVEKPKSHYGHLQVVGQ